MIDKMTIFTVDENTGNMTDNQLVGGGFEQFGEGEEKTTWWASDFMKMLGYPHMASFSNVIRRAMTSCLSANIDTHGDFEHANRIVDDELIDDYRLTRFACYMVAMNGDPKKVEVATAQIYFAKTAESVNIALQGSVDVDRLTLRGEIKEGNKALFSVAKSVGVRDYAMFNDAGYKGMYNMSMPKLLKHKKVDKDLFDYMGKEELSANQFRITMTAAKLRTRNVTNAGRKPQDVMRCGGKCS